MKTYYLTPEGYNPLPTILSYDEKLFTWSAYNPYWQKTIAGLKVFEHQFEDFSYLVIQEELKEKGFSIYLINSTPWSKYGTFITSCDDVSFVSFDAINLLIAHYSDFGIIYHRDFSLFHQLHSIMFEWNTLTNINLILDEETSEKKVFSNEEIKNAIIERKCLD